MMDYRPVQDYTLLDLLSTEGKERLANQTQIHLTKLEMRPHCKINLRSKHLQSSGMLRSRVIIGPIIKTLVT